ncbi:MAG: site-specific integrase [Muribaculaceae bacterium]|nr:site-specific integrase [Muribaculaceae bacterium]
MTYIESLPRVSARKYGKFVYPYIDVCYSGNRKRMQIGCKVLSGQWCAEKQRAYVSPLLSVVDNHNNKVANEQIDAFLARYSEFIGYICSNNKSENFVIEFDKYMCKREEEAEKVDVFEIIKNVITNSTELGKGTKENYKDKGVRALEAFSTFRSHPIDNFEMIDADLIEEFVEFLKEGNYKQKDGSPYAMESLNSIIAYAVSAIKCAPSKYLSANQKRLIPQPKLKDKTSKDNEIGLRESEVVKLWKYCPENKRDEEIRDMFLLLCLTGQRVGDLEKIDAGFEIVEGIPCLKLVQEKCSHKLSNVIVFSLAKEILTKYETLPITNIKKRINKNMARIAKKAGIEGFEEVAKHIQGNDKPDVSRVERTSLIHSHTGRRTFVSMLSVRGWNYVQIGKHTGQEPETVSRYDKSTDIDKAIYKRMKPNERLQLEDDNVQEPSHAVASSPKLENRGIENLREGLSVLELLGARIDNRESLTFEDVVKLVQEREGDLMDRYGVKPDLLKAVFNMGLPMEKRADALGYIFSLIVG